MASNKELNERMQSLEVHVAGLQAMYELHIEEVSKTPLQEPPSKPFSDTAEAGDVYKECMGREYTILATDRRHSGEYVAQSDNGFLETRELGWLDGDNITIISRADAELLHRRIRLGSRARRKRDGSLATISSISRLSIAFTMDGDDRYSSIGPEFFDLDYDLVEF